MSVTDSMDGRPPITSSLIVGQATLLFRSSLARIAQVWVFAILIAFANEFLPAELGRIPVLVWTVVSAFLSIWVEAAGTRGLLHDKRRIWNLDGDFWRYCGATIVLASPFVLIGVLKFSFGLRGIAEVATIMLSLALIRFFLWPVGLLVGYRQMTASESARLMSGRLLTMIGAILIAMLYILPVILLPALIAMVLVSSESFHFAIVVLQILRAITSALAIIVSAALWAAMYKLTAELAEAGP